MARAKKDGTRRREMCRTGTIGTREAARVARGYGLALAARDVAALCDTWAFEAFPSVPWSEAQDYDGWEWCINPADFRSWCEWEAGRDDH